MAVVTVINRQLGKLLHGTTIRQTSTSATTTAQTSPSLLAQLEPSQLMRLASPRISSILSLFADGTISSSRSDESNSPPRSRDEYNRDDAAFSPYFRRGTHPACDQRDRSSFVVAPPQTTSTPPTKQSETAAADVAARATAVDIEPSLTRQELQKWQTPHMPLLTPKQLEATLMEIRRRQSHRRRERERQNSDSVSSALSSSSGSDETDGNDIQKQQQQQQQQEEEKKRIQQQQQQQQQSQQPQRRLQQLDSKKKEAAILLPLCTVRGTPSILFTRRSAQLSSHASQISFPGGYFDEELDAVDDSVDDDRSGGKCCENELAKRMDRRLVHTAVREMHEELCFNLEDAAFFGKRGYYEYYDNGGSSDAESSNNSQSSHHENDKTGKFNNNPRTNQSQSYEQQKQPQQQRQQHQHQQQTLTATNQPPPFLTILGQTQPVPQMSGHKVTPIVASINYDLPPPTSPTFHALFPGNPDEVDWIFTVPIVELMRGETSEPLRRWSRGDTARYGGKFEVWGPVFPVPDAVAYHCENEDENQKQDENHIDEKGRLWRKREGDKVWGLTASVLRPILYKVLIPVFGEEGLGVVGKEENSILGITSKL